MKFLNVRECNCWGRVIDGLNKKEEIEGRVHTKHTWIINYYNNWFSFEIDIINIKIPDKIKNVEENEFLQKISIFWGYEEICKYLSIQISPEDSISQLKMRIKDTSEYADEITIFKAIEGRRKI